MNKRHLLAAIAAACLLSVAQARAGSFDRIRLAANDDGGSFQVASITGHNLRWRYGGQGTGSASPVVVAGCPFPTAFADGCAASEGGEIIHPDFYTGFANGSGQVYTSSHPGDFNEIGVDYGAGVPLTKAAYKDPWTTPLPTGCSLTPQATAPGQTLPYKNIQCGDQNDPAALNTSILFSQFLLGVMPNAATPHGPTRILLPGNYMPASVLIEYNEGESDLSNPGTIGTSSGTGDLVENESPGPNFTGTNGDKCLNIEVYANTWNGHGDLHPEWNANFFNTRACKWREHNDADLNATARPATVQMLTLTPQLDYDHNLYNNWIMHPGDQHGEPTEFVPPSTPGGILRPTVTIAYNVEVQHANNGSVANDAFNYLSSGSPLGDSRDLGATWIEFAHGILHHNIMVSNYDFATFQGYVTATSSTTGKLTVLPGVTGYIGKFGGGGVDLYDQNGNDLGVELNDETSITNNTNGVALPNLDGVYPIVPESSSNAVTNIGSASSPVTFRTKYGYQSGNGLFSVGYDYQDDFEAYSNLYDITGAGSIGTCGGGTPIENLGGKFQGYITPDPNGGHATLTVVQMVPGGFVGGPSTTPTHGAILSGLSFSQTGATVSATATQSSSTVSLGGSVSQVEVTNTGSDTVYVALGSVSSQQATTSSTGVPADGQPHTITTSYGNTAYLASLDPNGTSTLSIVPLIYTTLYINSQLTITSTSTVNPSGAKYQEGTYLLNIPFNQSVGSASSPVTIQANESNYMNNLGVSPFVNEPYFGSVATGDPNVNMITGQVLDGAGVPSTATGAQKVSPTAQEWSYGSGPNSICIRHPTPVAR